MTGDSHPSLCRKYSRWDTLLLSSKCFSSLLLNELISWRIQLSGYRKYGHAQYRGIVYKSARRSNIRMQHEDINNIRIEKLAIFGYGHLKSKDTDNKSQSLECWTLSRTSLSSPDLNIHANLSTIRHALVLQSQTKGLDTSVLLRGPQKVALTKSTSVILLWYHIHTCTLACTICTDECTQCRRKFAFYRRQVCSWYLISKCHWNACAFSLVQVP